jgi:drug/metabolite transporter (DMT)-like permease
MSGDPALPRFVALQAARLAGALIALCGVVVLSHGQPVLAHVPDALGDGLIVAGALAFFVVPLALARRWKSHG